MLGFFVRGITFFALCKLMFHLIGYYPLSLYLNTPFSLDLSLFCLNMRALVSSKGQALPSTASPGGGYDAVVWSINQAL